MFCNIKPLSLSKWFLCLLMFTPCFASAEDLDLSDYDLVGIAPGTTEAEAVEKLANYFSVSPDEIELVREKEKASKKDGISPSVSKSYVYEGNRVSITFYPDYVNDNESVRVAGLIRYSFLRDGLRQEKDQFVIDFAEKLTAERDAPSVSRYGSFDWCTTKTVGKAWSCVTSKPYLAIDINGAQFRDPAYSSAWFRAAYR